MLFHWERSEYLKGYATGDIFAEASTVEEAKTLVLAEFETHFREHVIFLPDKTAALDEDALERYAQDLELLRDDIAKEPKVIECGAVFIRGSD
jgi:hypothetical protein